MKNNFKFQTYSALFLVSFLSVSSFSFAFSIEKLETGPLVWSGTANHELLTDIALARDFTVTLYPVGTDAAGKVTSFENNTIDLIKVTNRETDSKESTIEETHFDNESFVTGNNRLKDLRVQIARTALEGNYYGAQKLLGNALHTVQDFYAHTTWVQRGPGTSTLPILAPLGKDLGSVINISTLPSVLPCTPQNLTDRSVVSGAYFAVEQAAVGSFSYIFPGATVDKDPNTGLGIKGKCTHGKGNLYNIDGNGKGINKDSNRRDQFIDAMAAALQGTKQYVTDVIEELKGIGATNEHICGLLGQTLPPCSPPKASAKIPGILCPNTFRGTFENPDAGAGVIWNAKLNFSSCPPTGPQGTLTETRYFNGKEEKQVRYFSGSYTQSGVLTLAIASPYININKSTLVPCTGMRADIIISGEKLKGAWTSDNCLKGGSIVAPLF